MGWGSYWSLTGICAEVVFLNIQKLSGKGGEWGDNKVCKIIPQSEKRNGLWRAAGFQDTLASAEGAAEFNDNKH